MQRVVDWQSSVVMQVPGSLPPLAPPLDVPLAPPVVPPAPAPVPALAELLLHAAKNGSAHTISQPQRVRELANMRTLLAQRLATSWFAACGRISKIVRAAWTDSGTRRHIQIDGSF
jgi:hypothetical protein